MNPGTLLEWLAFLAAIAAVICTAMQLRTGQVHWAKWARRTALASVAAVAAALLLLVAYFLAPNLAIEYVFLYTRTDYPWYYRLVGTWGAQKGTILMWAAFIGAAVAWIMHRAGREQDVAQDLKLDGEPGTGPAGPATDAVAPTPDGIAPTTDPDMADRQRVWAWMQFFALLFLTAFLWLCVRQDTFAPTAAQFLAARPLGNGLNPVLLSPWILIHPPVQFLAYGLVTIPAAAALAYLATGRTEWAAMVRGESRFAWALYTLGLVLGAMWAYYTLSFGGYWAWDPVEVANLVPWLLLGVFLHFRAHHEKYGDYRVLAPLLGVAAFAFTLYQTIATRSGLWVSVHAFTDPTGTFARDPFLRFANILQADAQVASLVGLLAALIAGTLAMVLYRHMTPGRLRRILVAIPLAVGGAFLAAPTTAVALAWEAASYIGFGNTGLGVIAALLGLGLAIGVATGRRTDADDADADFDAAPVTYRGQLYWGTLVVLTGALAAFLLMLRGVNGIDVNVFLNLAPFFGFPLLVLLVPMFGHGLLARRTLWIVMAASATGGIIGALLWDPWPIGLAAAPLAIVAAVALLRFRQVLTPNRAATVQVATLALLVGGLASVVYWANPPSLVGFGSWQLHTGPALQLAGILAALLSIILLVAVGHGRNRTALRVAAGIQFVLWGFGLATVAAILALALSWRSDWRPGPAMAALRQRFMVSRNLAIQLIHIAVVFGLLGYAASTYAAHDPVGMERLDTDLGDGEVTDTASVGFLVLRSDEVRLRPGASGHAEQIHMLAAVEQDGERVGTGIIGFRWIEQVQAYEPETRVLRLSGWDLYLAGIAFCRDPTGVCERSSDWVDASQPGVVPLRPGETVTAVLFETKLLPLMGFLWSALYLFLAGITLLWLAGWLERRGPMKAEPVPVSATAVPRPQAAVAVSVSSPDAASQDPSSGHSVLPSGHTVRPAAEQRGPADPGNTP